ncbi:MAG: PAS domain-containing protein, partial [Thermostichus sp. DG02_5_bins_236]
MQTGFDALLENAPIGVFRMDLEGRCLFANSKLVQLYGYASGEQLRQHLSDFGHSRYADGLSRRQFFQDLLQDKTGNGGAPQEFALCNPPEVWVREQVQVVRSSTGDPVYFEGYV